MNASTAVERIDILLGPAAESPYLDLQRTNEIEGLTQTLGEHPGIIGETLREFRRALGLLKMRLAAGESDSIALNSAHVREMWEMLSPALRKLAVTAER